MYSWIAPIPKCAHGNRIFIQKTQEKTVLLFFVETKTKNSRKMRKNYFQIQFLGDEWRNTYCRCMTEAYT